MNSGERNFFCFASCCTVAFSVGGGHEGELAQKINRILESPRKRLEGGQIISALLVIRIFRLKIVVVDRLLNAVKNLRRRNRLAFGCDFIQRVAELLPSFRRFLSNAALPEPGLKIAALSFRR